MRWIERRAADLACLQGALRTLKATTPIARHPRRVFPLVIDALADRYGDAPALLSDRESFTYRELAARANRYAHWALAQGIRKGDAVCLMMPNRPEYMAIWLGITRVGGVVALININLTGTALAHCINVVEPKHIIVAAELLARLETARPLITHDPRLWLHGNAPSDFARIDLAIAAMSEARIANAEAAALTIEDHALYIYTSGTTGLPKAANINHYRLMLASFAFAGVMATRASDRMYDCLPMYHTAGGLVATGALLVRGGSVVIREKFSAHEFWDDVVRWDCTLFQYIGELCRYLLNSPPHPKEAAHRLRLACGNGLRPDVWHEFKRRFRIPHIIEFYAATEGNVTLFNFEDREGSVGRIPWFLEARFPTKIVRFDVESQQPVRGPQGFCIECDAGETGEVIGKILRDASKPGARFEGYATQKETDRKILHDVFAKGDAWFRTGDLMRKDADGYFYFVDRIGDTFRWKGENVSTTEVEEVIGQFPGVAETNVYGVQVPGREGRAGMAALVVDPALDRAALRAYLAKRLPDYARPLFLRIRGEMDVTSTFKQKKIDFVAQGFDPAATSDPIYFDDAVAQSFVRVDGEVLERIPQRPGPAVSALHDPDEVLRFWRAAGPQRWFHKDAEFDRAITARFLDWYEAAVRGDFAPWEASPEGTLALLIVLDQFPRNMFRASARAFAADPLARAVAERAIARGFDSRAASDERIFFYLPFMHSEQLADQQRSLELTRQCDESTVHYAKLHADIIRRFGRFPHRNAALGRSATAAEQAFLDGGGFAG